MSIHNTSIKCNIFRIINDTHSFKGSADNLVTGLKRTVMFNGRRSLSFPKSGESFWEEVERGSNIRRQWITGPDERGGTERTLEERIKERERGRERE